jgi:hypothetical protein
VVFVVFVPASVKADGSLAGCVRRADAHVDGGIGAGEGECGRTKCEGHSFVRDEARIEGSVFSFYQCSFGELCFFILIFYMNWGLDYQSLFVNICTVHRKNRSEANYLAARACLRNKSTTHATHTPWD